MRWSMKEASGKQAWVQVARLWQKVRQRGEVGVVMSWQATRIGKVDYPRA